MATRAKTTKAKAQASKKPAGKSSPRSKRARHTKTQVMKALKAAGSAQTAKTYRNHGVQGELFGVSYAFLKTFEKQVEHDLALAAALWATGNHDARVFACWIADADAVSASILDGWAAEVADHALAGEVASLAAYTNLGAALSRKWRKRKAEWRATLGWSVVATLAMQPGRGVDEGGLADDELLECLETIEQGIHSAPNRVRHAMNRALITIGCRSSTSAAALAAAKRVGPVEVDHGPTSCKTSVAHEAIRKTLDHYAAKGKLPTDGAAGKRRRHC